MSTRRTTHDKRQRERSKQQKAAAKRDKRQGRSDGESDGPRTEDAADVRVDDRRDSTEQLLERIETLHANYDAGNIPFEDFEEQRAELLDRIALRLAE